MLRGDLEGTGLAGWEGGGGFRSVGLEEEGAARVLMNFWRRVSLGGMLRWMRDSVMGCYALTEVTT